MEEKMNSIEESWENATFANNFLFCKILENEPDLCKQLIELLLHIKIDHLEPPQSEKMIKESFDSKSVRFDVYTKDEKRIFDLEMQTVTKKNLRKRARYYQSIIDTSNLAAGVNYNQLKDTYVIFICLDDIFNKGLPVYSFENTCLEDKRLKLHDGTYKVFFNVADCDKLKSDEEKTFFRFLQGGHAESEFTKNLGKKLAYAKKNSEWRRQYMTWQQTIMDERYWARLEGHDEGYTEGHDEGYSEGHDEGYSVGRSEGYSQGHAQGIEQGIEQGTRTAKIETARNFLSMGLTAEQISQGTGLAVAEIEALAVQ